MTRHSFVATLQQALGFRGVSRVTGISRRESLVIFDVICRPTSA